MVKVKGTSSEFIRDMYDVDDQNKVKSEVSKWFKSNYIHRELHKHLTFHDKFDLEGQGKELQTCPKPLDDQ